MLPAFKQPDAPLEESGSGPPDGVFIPDALEQPFTVSFSYPVHFTRGVFRVDNPVLANVLKRREAHRRHRCLVIVDSGVAEAWPGLADSIEEYARAHPETMALVCPPVVLPGGEVAKNDPTVAESVVASVNEHRIDRQSFVICVGGGALLDAVGYAAAIAHRGVRMVRLPTTVLSQNDSGVGVKNGINTFGKKNFTGTFAPPFAVLNDLDFLQTLSPDLARAGMSEAVKVALIKDARFLEWIEEHAGRLSALDPASVEYLVRRCAQLHLQHITTSGDPFELHSARPLDFGHWSAHRMESLSHSRMSHGDAVAIGIAIDTLYSSRIGLLPPTDAERVLTVLEALGFHLWDGVLAQRDGDGRLSVMSGLAEFREHLGGELSVTLLSAIGTGVEVHEIDLAAMTESIETLRLRHSARHR